MKIFHFSDTHGYHGQINIPECNVIIFSGDHSNHREVSLNEKEFFDFIEWYSKIDHPYKILIAGNHDTYIAERKKDAERIMKEAGLIYLNKNSTTINGIKFYGEPLTPTFGNWSFMVDRAKIHKHWEVMPDNTNVLITHGPSKGVLDLSYNRDGVLEFCGDSAQLKAISKRSSIKAVLSGHIHDCEDIRNAGVLLRDNIIFSNASCVKDGKWGKLYNYGNLIEI